MVQSYTLNITTLQGFETFMLSLENKTFCPSKEGIGVDLVLSCVDNYEARMVVNQVRVILRRIYHFHLSNSFHLLCYVNLLFF